MQIVHAVEISVGNRKKRLAMRLPKYHEDNGDVTPIYTQLMKGPRPNASPHVASSLFSLSVTMPNGLTAPATFMHHYETDLQKKQEEGGSIRQFSPPETAHYLAQIALGLNDSGLVHLDLKSANCLVNGTQLAVSDWDMALSPGKIQPMYRGTEMNSAPEQFSNNYKADQRSDVYALGLIGCEMATGANPRFQYYQNTPKIHHLSNPFAKDPNNYTSGKDHVLDQILQKCTQPLLEDRPQLKDVLVDLCAFPNVHHLISDNLRRELGESLIQRDPLDCQSPDVDARAALGIAKHLGPDDGELKRQLHAYSEEIADYYGVTPTAPLPMANFRISAPPNVAAITPQFVKSELATTGIRGLLVAKPDPQDANAPNTQQYAQLAKTWRAASQSSDFTPEQARIIQSLSSLPQVQHVAGAKRPHAIASILADDWEHFRKLDAPTGTLHVRCKLDKDWIYQGAATIGSEGLLKQGPWLLTDTDKHVRGVVTYRDDQLHGSSQQFAEDGALIGHAHYVNGHKHGTCHDENGVRQYEHGQSMLQKQTATRHRTPTTTQAH